MDRSWSMSSAEVQGSGHRKAGIPCQDCTLTYSLNGVHVVTLADGAGSARLSHFGARAVTSAMAHAVVRDFQCFINMSDEGIRAWARGVITYALEGVAKKEACRLSDLSSTLLLVAVKKQRFLALHIGDGVIGCFEHHGLSVLSAPENGEFSNQTWFTTTLSKADSLRVYRGDVSSTSGFILMSDGVEPSLYDMRNKQLSDAAINLLIHNQRIPSRKMSELLEQSMEMSIVPRTTDDCSIALLSRSRTKNLSEYESYLRCSAERDKKDRGAEHA